MRLLERSNVNIREIITEQGVAIYFQPIVSIKKKSMIGIEALCRGIGVDGSYILPSILFSLAKAEELTVDFDRLCRKKALESYSRIHSGDNDLILFLNIDTSVIDKGVVGSGHLLNMVNDFKIDPGNVAIEIVESKVDDVTALERFVNTYREYGFLIALDDVGSGYSNLDRIPLVKPDILKIDKSLITEIDKKYYKQEVFKSLVNLSKKIGALIVAEGVEREEEAIMALELGADLLQGFYYAKPQEINSGIVEECAGKIARTASKFKSYMVNKINRIRFQHWEYGRIIDEIIETLSQAPVEHFDDYLSRIIRASPVLECIYILDKAGMQMSETHCNLLLPAKNRRLIYRPAQTGTEHTLKDYYYMLVHAGFKKYTTEPYISLASGNLCITISTFFKNFSIDEYILCVDINPEII